MNAIKPIRTETDYRQALARVETLFEAAPGTPEFDELDILGTLICAYEAANFPISAPASAEPSETVEAFFWTAIGNIVAERPYGLGGEETRLGTKHFRPGAKVYIIDYFPGMCDSVVVIGYHRKSNRPIKAIVKAKYIENLRVKSCYSVAAIRLIKEHQANPPTPKLTQEFAETLCRVLPHWR